MRDRGIHRIATSVKNEVTKKHFIGGSESHLSGGFQLLLPKYFGRCQGPMNAILLLYMAVG